jgi:hypothetical protein
LFLLRLFSRRLSNVAVTATLSTGMADTGGKDSQ